MTLEATARSARDALRGLACLSGYWRWAPRQAAGAADASRAR